MAGQLAGLRQLSLFSAPNTNALMTAVEPHRRGSAAGIYTMLMNTGQMLSIAAGPTGLQPS